MLTDGLNIVEELLEFDRGFFQADFQGNSKHGSVDPNESMFLIIIFPNLVFEKFAFVRGCFLIRFMEFKVLKFPDTGYMVEHQFGNYSEADLCLIWFVQKVL